MKTLLERLPIYILPVALVVLEWVIRSAFAIDTQAFIGPSLASIGIGLVMPLTTRRTVEFDIPTQFEAMLEQKGWAVVSTQEQRFIQICWVSIPILMAMWAVTLYASTKFPLQYWRNLALGTVNFMAGILLSEARERI